MTQRPLPDLQQKKLEVLGVLERLAHTERLAGDYVAAQAVEREVRRQRAEAQGRLNSCG